MIKAFSKFSVVINQSSNKSNYYQFFLSILTDLGARQGLLWLFLYGRFSLNQKFWFQILKKFQMRMEEHFKADSLGRTSFSKISSWKFLFPSNLLSEF